MANVFHPRTTHESIAHEGGGETPGIKDNDNKWNAQGHKNRVVDVDLDRLALIARIRGEGEASAPGVPLPALHSTELLSALAKFGNHSVRLADLDQAWTPTEMWNETGAQREGLIRRRTGFVQRIEDLVLSGPHLGVGNPLAKTPKRVCETHKAYLPIDLEFVPDDYLPRTNYIPAASTTTYRASIPRVSWANSEALLNFKWVALREG